jgi:hypothetical protein
LRSISVADATFSTKISSDPAAIKLLEAAGFQAVRNVTDLSTSEAPVLSYDLTHNNAAILNLVAQVG